eukprot:GHVU01058566.1.p1 GENE.GHVU01058566.1~~GHVU01058566.1.p1  ORF type:complete len:241 (+),score=4.47 GHVU01058566.1:478-1200(+)
MPSRTCVAARRLKLQEDDEQRLQATSPEGEAAGFALESIVPDCPICWNPMRTDQVVLPCQHVFHKTCVSGTRNRTCPLCREAFHPKDIRALRFDISQRQVPVEHFTKASQFMRSVFADEYARDYVSSEVAEGISVYKLRTDLRSKCYCGRGHGPDCRCTRIFHVGTPGARPDQETPRLMLLLGQTGSGKTTMTGKAGVGSERSCNCGFHVGLVLTVITCRRRGELLLWCRVRRHLPVQAG